MLSLESMNLSRFILFDNVNFKFNKGISLVNGRNKSGKSLLFKGISTAFYGKETGDKLPTSSKIVLDYSNISLVKDKEKSDDYSLSIKMNKSPSYNLFKNGNDLHPHKISDALDLVRRSNPIPYPLWLATVDLSSKDHPLTHGSPTTRAEWLSLVLDLSTVYDNYLLAVKHELDKIEKARTEYNVLAFEKEEIEKSIPKNTTGIKSKDHLEEVKQSLQSYLDEGKKITSELISIQNQLMILEQLPKDYEIIDDIKSEKKRLDALMDYRAKLRILKEEAAEFENIDDKDVEEFKRLSKYAKKAKSIEKYRKRQRELSEIVDTFETEEQTWHREKKYRELRANLAKTVIWNQSDDLQNQYQGLKFEISGLKTYGKNLSALIEGKSDKEITCSSCGSIVDVKHAKKELAKMRKTYAEKKVEYEKVQDNLDKYQQYEDVCSKITLNKKPETPHAEIEELDKLNKLIAKIQRYQELKETVGDLKVPPLFTEHAIEKLEKVQKKIDTLSEKISTYTVIKHALKNYREDVTEIIQEGPEKVQKQISKLKKRQTEIMSFNEESQATILQYRNDVLNYEAYRTARASYSNNLSRLTDKLEELKKVTKNYEAYKALQVAFGNNGLRLQQLQDSANHLSTKMTELSSLFYGNRYQFNIDVKPRKLDLTVERNGIEGSLKSLSGSESRLFSLLFAMSLLYVLPNRLRCDTMILDEMEANQDKPAREAYSQEILPELSNLVDKVVVVSPLMYGELNISADYRYLISKRNKNGRWLSSISEG